MTATSPTLSFGTGNSNGTLTIRDTNGAPNTLLTLVDNGSNGTLSVANINGTSALQLNGTDINTAGTLTNVAYENQANTFTQAQTISSGGLTISAGGASVTGGLNNNSGGITNAGAVSGVTTLAANNTVTLSAAAPLALSNNAAAISLATAGNNGTLTIRDAEGSPNTLLTLTDNGTTGTLSVATINATSALQLNGTSINTAGTLSNVAYLNQSNSFSAGQTISTGGLTISAGGASVTGGINNNSGGITNAGAIAGATNITASGTIQGATINGTSAIQLNGTSINTTGTLTNVAYKGQDNNFTVGQTIAGATSITSGGLAVTGGIDNNTGGLTEAGAISGATTIAASGTVTLSGASPLTLSNTTPAVTVGTAGNNATLTFQDGDANALATLTDTGSTANLSVSGTINAVSGFNLNGTSINTTGTLTNVAYKGQNNNFTVGQTIAGATNISSGGLQVTGGIDNNSGGLTEAGAVSGVTTLAASGTITASGANPLALSNNTPAISLATAGNNGTLTIRDAEGSPNTLLTLADNGTSGTLTVGVINATSDLQINGVSINLSNVAYLNQANNFSAQQTISSGGLVVSADGISNTGGLDNNSGGITEAGAISGATSVTASGTIQGATLNGTSAIQLNGTSINTTGTLTNVAYKGQNNNFTTAQSIAGTLTVSTGGVVVSAGGADITGGFDNNAGGITDVGSIAGATSIAASGTVTLSGASPLTLTNSAPLVTLGTAGVNGTLSVRDGDSNTLMTLTDAGTTGNLSVTGTINATSALNLNGTSINTTGTLTNVAYKGQNNNFTTAQSIAGALTVSTGGASITGGLNNNSGNITNAGSLAGVTTISASGLATLSSGTPLALTSNTPAISLATAGNNGTLTIRDAEGSPNTLLTLTDNGTTGTLATGVVNATSALQLNGTSINTTGTLTNVAYKGQDNNFTAAQTIAGALTVSTGGASITGGFNNNNGNITNAGSLAGVTTISASGLATLSSATPFALTNANPVISLATIGNNGSLTIRDAESSPNTLMTLTDNGTSATLEVANINASTALFVGGNNINTAGTLTNVAYKGQNNNFTVGQTIAGATSITSGGLTVAGGANLTGGVDNNSGGITETGAVAGATTINASGAVTFSGLGSATPTTMICRDSSNNLVTCGGGLQTVYDIGNSITTTNARDITFNLADTATDATFALNNAGIANAFTITDNNAGTGIALAVKSASTTNLTINENGVISVVGGASSALTTLAGGSALSLQPAANGSGAGGALNLNGGNGTTTGGNVVIDGGTGATPGSVNLAGTTGSLNLGRTGLTTANLGSLTVTQALTASNGFTMTTGALSLTATSGSINATGLTSATIGSTGTFALNGAPLNINTCGTATCGDTSIGNTQTGADLTFTSGANATQSFLSSNTTPTGANSAYLFNASALTSGNAMYLTSNTINSGSLLTIETGAGNTFSSGTLSKIVSSSTGGAGQTSSMFDITRSGGNATHTAYGVRSTLTTSGTNYAGYFSASGGTNNYAAIFDAGNVGFGTTTPTEKVAVGAGNNFGINVGAPTTLTLTPAGSGGSFAAGTYFYKVTALDAAGNETTPSTQNSATVVLNGTINVAWTATTGAASYRVYRGTSSNNQTLYFTTTTNSYLDTGTAGTAGTVPTGNNNAYAIKLLNNGNAYMSGNLGIGDGSPVAPLTVGNGDRFQVSALGNMFFNFLSPVISFLNGGSLSLNDGTNNIFTFNDGASLSTLTLGAHGVTNGELVFASSGAGETDPLITAEADGDLWMRAPSGTTVVGAGNGNITIDPGANAIFLLGDTTWTLPATDNVNVNSTGSTKSSLTSGVLDLNIDSSTNLNVGMTIDYQSNNGVTAGNDLYGTRLTVTQNDADGDLFGMQIINADTASAGSVDDLLSIINADASGSTVDNGINVFSNGAVITDALDVSDAEIVNALNIGANAIIGTTGTIDFTNFDVATNGTTTIGGGLTINATTGNGIDITNAGITTDIVMQNDESIDNNTNGTITFTAPTSAFTGNLDVNGTGANDIEGTLQIDLEVGASDEAVCKSGAEDATGDVILRDCTTGVTADYMELYPMATDVEPTDLVATSNEFVTTIHGERVAKLVKTTSAYQSTVLGIASDPENISDFNTIGKNLNESDNPQPVALNGRVLVKVASDSEAINPGDYVTTSAQAGKAMKATQSGIMVGKALDSWTSGTGQETVMVYVNLNYVDLNQTGPTYTGIGEWTHDGNFDILGNLTAQSITTSGLNVASGGASINGGLNNNYGGITNAGSLDGVTSITASGVISTSALIQAPLIDLLAGSIEGLDGNVISKLASDYTGTDANKFMWKNAANQDLFSIDSTGNATLSGTLTTSGGNYDLAEDYATTDDSLQAGDVVSIDTINDESVVKTTQAYDNTILGIYSEKPGFRLSQADATINGNRAIPVALAGRVPVKVNTENGQIKKGDYLTSSSTPGVAMKATKPGQVLGKALEDFNGEGIGKVTAFVNVTFADPQNKLAILTDDVTEVDASKVSLPSNLVIDGTTVNGSLADAFLAINNSLTPKTMAINELQAKQLSLEQKTEQLDTRLTELEDKEASQEAFITDTKDLAQQAVDETAVLGDKVASNEAALASLQEQINNASSSAELSSLSQKLDELLARISVTPTPETTEEPTPTASASATPTPTPNDEDLTNPDLLIATDSATPTDAGFFSTATVSGEFTAYAATIQNTFKSFGKSYLGDTTISGDVMITGKTALEETNVAGVLSVDDRIAVGSTLSITENQINVNGTPIEDGEEPTDGILFLQKSPLANLLDIFNGALIIDKLGNMITKGNIVAKNLETKENIKVGGNIDLSGAITISATAGETIQKGDALYISDNNEVMIADATDETKTIVVGIAAGDAALGEKVTIIIGGKANVLENLEAGKQYFLGIAGTLVDEAPLDAIKSVPVGVAFSATEMIMQITSETKEAVEEVNPLN